MKRHEDMLGVYGFGDAYEEVVDATAFGDECNTIGGFDAEELGGAWVDFDPGFGGETFEGGDETGFGAGMPVLYGTTSVEDESVGVAGLFFEFVGGGEQ